MRRKSLSRRNFLRNGSSEKESILNFSDMTIYISLITALGYFIAYSYKKGYRSYYGLNEVLINQIDLSSVLLSITFIFSTLIVFLGLYNNFKILFFGYENIFLKVFERKLFVLFFVYLGVNFLYNNRKFLLYTSIILLILIIIVYFSPIISHRNIEGYRNKLKNSLKEKENDSKSIMDKILNIIRNDLKAAFMLLVILFFTCISVSTVLGISDAKKQKDYYILKNKNKTYVVIDSYSDKFIIAPINLKTNIIEKKFLIIEGKSTLKDPTVFEKIKINDGIK